MIKPLRLVISGLALRHPEVGTGVYTRRLIQGLLRHAPTEVALTVLLPASLRPEALPWLPPAHVQMVQEPPHFLPALLWDTWLFQRMAHAADARDATSIFHSPIPAWAPSRPRNTVVTLHDCIYRRFPRYLGRRFIRKQLLFATERYAAGAERVLAPSQCAARDLAQLAGIPAEKIRVVSNWVGPEFERSAAKAAVPTVRLKYKLPADYWLYLGGYDYRKNIEFLIRAYAEARRRIFCPPLVLCGKIPHNLTKPYCDVYGAIRAAGLDEKTVLLPGVIEDVDLPGVYAGASLFLYPSLYEGFGLPPAEAATVGTPVLVANGSSLPEVIPDATCRFDPVDPADLIAQLEAASSDPSRFLCTLPAGISEAAAIAAYLAILRTIRTDSD